MALAPVVIISSISTVGPYHEPTVKIIFTTRSTSIMLFYLETGEAFSLPVSIKQVVKITVVKIIFVVAYLL